MFNARCNEFVVFDVETTGLSHLDGDRIIEIAAVKVKNGEIVDRLYSLVNPQRPIPASATLVNNITEEMVQEAPKAVEILPKMIDFIGNACLAGHNAKFDLCFLCYELAMAGRKLHPHTPVVDTLKMARMLLPYLTSYKLGYVATSFGVKIGTTHRAMADVELTVAILKRLMDMAGDQNLDAFDVFLAHFGVEKPNFAITQAQPAQTFLF